MPQTIVVAFCRVCQHTGSIKTAFPVEVLDSQTPDFAIPCDDCRARIYPGLEVTQ